METTISRVAVGDPTIGERHENGKWRVVIGWNHTNDTAEGVKEGRIWCWVSKPPEKLQVYDEDFNRSPIPGDRRDCGVANFTMIRMFHEYWTYLGSVPHDGVSEDKARCRAKYHELIHKHRLSLGLPVDDSPEECAARNAAGRKGRAGGRNREKVQTDLRRYFPSAKDGAGAQQVEGCKDQLLEALEIAEGCFAESSVFID